jgi:hypothetical protein
MSFDVHVRFASHDWAPQPPRHPGIGCGVDGSTSALAAAATANGQWTVLLRTCGLFLLTKATPDYRRCGMAAPALVSMGLETREKEVKASRGVGGGREPRWRVTCRLRPLHARRTLIGQSCQKRPSVWMITAAPAHPDAKPPPRGSLALGKTTILLLLHLLLLLPSFLPHPPPPPSSPPSSLSWWPFPLTTK